MHYQSNAIGVKSWSHSLPMLQTEKIHHQAIRILIPLRRLQTEKMYCHPLQSTAIIEYRSHLYFGSSGAFNFNEWSPRPGFWKRWLWVLEQMWILNLTWNEMADGCCCTSFVEIYGLHERRNKIHILCVSCKMRWALAVVALLFVQVSGLHKRKQHTHYVRWAGRWLL